MHVFEQVENPIKLQYRELSFRKPLEIIVDTTNHSSILTFCIAFQSYGNFYEKPLSREPDIISLKSFFGLVTDASVIIF